MSERGAIASQIVRRAQNHQRFVVAIAGPPGSGKSTLAAELQTLLPAGETVVVPMDGFHYDDVVLERRGLRSRKGAPETFDFGGFQVLLKRIRAHDEAEIAIPVFDRTMELSRAGADIISADTRFILVEGNYLLLDEAPWSTLGPLFDWTIMLDVPVATLEQRLVERWRFHGKSDAEGLAWIAFNDRPNIDRVLAHQRPADLVVSTPAQEVDQPVDAQG
ncbi:nucleoside triphosphate hydrolase [Tianweitania sp. BSSL-BM11]|uniref:Nucleoside triphosphate hydrolase n=1 Tax=Tianweitania aestuarii TaxID=2814886 RepID=A0ABS5RXZ0_9HYPH|nr:nucleoside triphosphate hydrolase [Tianweitania aestuarii]MBS9721894.1 nucleoside triphosphate hydrolase [Tianweitania aestuarii]